MHLSDEQIQRLIHGELDATSRDVATRHARECPSCAQALATAEHEETAIFDLLGTVDHEMPAVDAAKITTVPAHGRLAVWGRRAASIVIVAAVAGAAYAIPGSPLPDLVKQLAAIMTGERETPPAAVDESTPGPPGTSGIAVAAGDHFVIQFAGPQDSSFVLVSLTDDPMVRVRVLGGTAAFTTDAGRLDIENRGSIANYEISLPRDAPWIEVRVGSTARWQKDGERVSSGSVPDAQGRYWIALAPPAEY